jgi:DNA-binding CsgD family transcriptional regulator
MQESWDSYLETFTKVHPDFQSILWNKYPDLTDMEIKIYILIRAGLQSEAILHILSLSPRTIENHRFNLRKKLNITARGSLGKCLQNL